MVKVQNGWESHNIDELERLSQQASPISPMPRFRNLDDASPPYHRSEQIRFTTAAHHALLTPELAHSKIPNGSGPTSERGTPQTSSPVQSTPSALSSRTYEAFWREHSINSPSKPLQTPIQPSLKPSLGPPADILPRSRPESGVLDTPRFLAAKTPKLDGAVRNDKAISSREVSPATPARQRPAIRTASQNAAMEKDAVETLLFMSSPGNSGHHPATRPLDTPSPRNFPRPTKQVGFADVGGGRYPNNPDHFPVAPVQPYLCEQGLLKPGQRLTVADVDRYLDQMPDDSSSSSDENDDLLYNRPRSHPYLHR